MNYTLPQFELDNKEATVSILFMYVYTTFDSFDITNSVTLYTVYLFEYLFISFDTFDIHISYFIVICNVPCSMQHALSTLSTYHTLDLATRSFLHSSFWREYFLDTSNHLPDQLLANSGKHDPIKPLIFADNTD